MSTAPIRTVWLGEVAYDQALSWQERLVEARQADEINDVMLVLTHPPVYTAGRHADVDATVTGTRPDIPVVQIDRGGDVTYHGPGQIVVYPIMRLAQRRATKAYVTALEEGILTTLDRFAVPAIRRPEYPGVWVEGTPPNKIAAIGVRITNGVTKHGIAVNVAPDLRDFDGIIACGIRDGDVTSIREQNPSLTTALFNPRSTEPDETGQPLTDAELLDAARNALTTDVATALGRRPVPTDPGELGLPAPTSEAE